MKGEQNLTEVVALRTLHSLHLIYSVKWLVCNATYFLQNTAFLESK